MLGHGPISDQPISSLREFAAGAAPKPVAEYVSNAAAPQIANYALIAGIGFFCVSAIAPQGSVSAAEYTFGTHAVALHQAEALKSKIWASVAAAPTAAAQPLRSIWAAPQITTQIQGWIETPLANAQGIVPALDISIPQADPSQIAPVIWKSQPAAAAAPNPVAPFFYASQQAYDLTIQASLARPLTTPQGPVPPLAARAPQADPSQIAPVIWKSQPAAAVVPNPAAAFFYAAQQFYDRTLPAEIFTPLFTPQGRVPPAVIVPPQADPSQIAAQVFEPLVAPPIVPNPIATFFSVPPQTEDRQTRVVWPSQRAGARPPVITSIWAAPQVVDLTQQAVFVQPSITPVVVSYGFRSIYAAPQLIDLTQQGWILETAPGRQGAVPPQLWASQVDPSQIPAAVWKSVRTPPILTGAVPPLVRAGQPQVDPTQREAHVWSPIIFSTVTAVFGNPRWRFTGAPGPARIDLAQNQPEPKRLGNQENAPTMPRIGSERVDE